MCKNLKMYQMDCNVIPCNKMTFLVKLPAHPCSCRFLLPFFAAMRSHDYD